MNSAARIDKISCLLEKAFSPDVLQVIDDSDHHIGHVGAKDGAGHFTIKIAAAAFSGKDLIQCHKMVYQQLQQMMPDDIHALSIKIQRTC